MLRHIVMMKFNDKEPIDKVSYEIKEMLTSLVNKIDSLKSMEVGLNISTKPSAHHLVLIADFDDEKGLNIYREHPEHVKILDRMKMVVEKTAVVDYIA